ncbi:hypothetical protein [Novosphingobium arvoryzae]|uniref:Uncharacterized protein n=1 Tax=Novosphingobium arvoryzae TaxID=1256514 RepID=A0A918VD94_9SPHN|nr:hypothetical protein [Novosphingobium arvoryzae]GGZ92482.1 hypothetical protein GCM10011617_10000 [Novosphingobium arvoryzae]
MATQPPFNGNGRVLEPLSGPQHFVPPTARELRAQAVQRLQAGLFGLAAIVLIVGLANIINDRARLSEAANPAPPSAMEAKDGSEAKADPLADAGVVPATKAEETPAAAAPGGPAN